MCMRSSNAMGAVNAVRRNGTRQPHNNSWAVWVQQQGADWALTGMLLGVVQQHMQPSLLGVVQQHMQPSLLATC
jgi:hypothetical protein